MVAILVSPPATEPVTREDAKLHARIDSSAEDDLIDALIKSARVEVENRTGRALISQRWRIVRDGVPRGGVMRVAPGPVTSLDAVTVYGSDGLPRLIAPDEYEVDLISTPGRLKLKAGRFWGARSMNGLEVDFTCGYGDPTDVPAPLRHAVLLLVAHWYENREAAHVGALAGAVTHGVGALLAPYRMPRFA